MNRGNWNKESEKKVGIITSGRTSIKGAAPSSVNPTIVNGFGESNSNYYLSNRAVGSEVSPKVLKNLSEYRQEEILSGSNTRSSGFKVPGPQIVHSTTYNPNLVKKADAGVASSLTNSRSDTVRMAPEVYSPLFQIANLQLPRDRITMNAWNRNFYDTHPLVRNCINLHATYPISKINIKCSNRKVEQFFNDMCQELDIHSVLSNVALEIWKLGESFPYAELDETRGTWKSIRCLNPDYIHVKQSVVGGEPIISMRPDASLQRLVMSNNPADVQLRSQIPEEILYHIRKGNNIPLDNFHVSHLKILSSPYDLHGTSIIVSVYKDLMHYDKLREAKFAQADGFVNPITVVKVGGNNDGDYRATEADLEKWRQTFEAAQYDKDFKIISHAGIDITRVGASGQVIDISSDIQMIIDNILYGLMTPKAVITQEGSSYNTASIGLEVLKQRYETFRNGISQWLIKKVFAPISEIQGFYEYKDKVKKLIVPEIEWNSMILFDMNDYINNLKDLAKDKQISKATLFKSLGLNEDQERRKLREEAIKQAILEKEEGILKTMSLGALRALSPDDDIIEPTMDALPGTTSEDSGSTSPGAEGVPGTEAPDLGIGDLGIPSAPSGGESPATPPAPNTEAPTEAPAPPAGEAPAAPVGPTT